MIAQGLGGGRQKDGFIQGSGWVVTWCFGHLFEMCMPDDYDARFKRWTREDLPIVPDTFQLKPRKNARPQIKVIRGLLKDAHEVVNAGDPDREGQLLVDEVLWELRNKKPVSRIWLPALDDKSVQKALSMLTPNENHRGLCHAALARGRADWLVGLNLTRGYTIRAGRTVTVGRVQTPTLNLVVKRDLEIENFVAKDFFTLQAVFKHANGTYAGTWTAKDSPAVQKMGDKADKFFDEEGRCLDKRLTEKILGAIQGKEGCIEKLYDKTQKEPAPLPFSLSDLQSEASRRFGMGAQQTLDTAQSLYEKHKATTYPRTDCRHLSSGQLQEVRSTLQAMATVDATFKPLIDRANPQRKGRAFDDKKVTAHTAIIPTDNPGFRISNLSPQEFKLYDLIRRRYLAQFYPEHLYKELTLTTVVMQEPFFSKAKTTLEEGWKTLFQKESPKNKDAKPEEKELPKGMVQGDPVMALKGEVVSKQTTPPARFTEGTLIRAMANIARYVDDERAKKRLRETSGIGTEATRAGIIENLKKRGFLFAKGKSLISSAEGRELIKVVAPPLKDPVTTAQWEDRMLDIESGRVGLGKFVESISDWVTKILELADGAEFQSIPAPHGKKQGAGRSLKKSNPPTPKMVAFARTLAKQKGLKRLPKGVASDFQTCREFLDKHAVRKN